MSSLSISPEWAEAEPGCFDLAAFAQMQRMVTDLERMYRERNEAPEMLRAERGPAFDPHLVDLFNANAPLVIALRDRVNPLAPNFADLVAGLPDPHEH